MTHFLRRLLLVPVVVLLGYSQGLAADYESGFEAYKSGDYTRAFNDWNAAANQGDVEAQYRLGTLFEDGIGVTQDLVQAYVWYSLAAAKGHDIASESQTVILRRLSNEQLVAGRRLVDDFSAKPLESTRQKLSAADRSTDARELVRLIQVELNRLGYVPGAADGIAGQDTRRAIRSFQLSSGVSVDGEASSSLLELLRARHGQSSSTEVVSSAASDDEVTRSEASGEDAVEARSSATQQTPTRSTAGLKLAILPLAGRPDRFLSETVCDEVATGLSGVTFSRIAISHAGIHCRSGNLGSKPQSMDQFDRKKLWQKGLFDTKLDSTFAADVGRRLGADIVLALVVKESLAYENPGAVDIVVKRMYLVDSADHDVWSEAGSPGHAVQGAASSEIPSILRKLLDRYRLKHAH